MDDVLASNPTKFKMLRAFWKLSFLKIDDDENKALKDVILKNNQDTLTNPNKSNCFAFSPKTHLSIINKLSTNNYILNINEMLKACSNKNTIEHEMAIEAGTLYQLSRNISNTVEIFGSFLAAAVLGLIVVRICNWSFLKKYPQYKHRPDEAFVYTTWRKIKDFLRNLKNNQPPIR